MPAKSVVMAVVLSGWLVALVMAGLIVAYTGFFGVGALGLLILCFSFIVDQDRDGAVGAGVEHVMGFCTDEEHTEFLRSVPLFEEMLVRSGIHLVKFWFSVNDEEQERRFLERVRNPFKRWKLSPMDLESRKRWVEYSKAKDLMFEHTDRNETPWYVVNADKKKRARLNCIRHLLDQIPYHDMKPVEIEIPPRQSDDGYKRPKQSTQRFVREVY